MALVWISHCTLMNIHCFYAVLPPKASWSVFAQRGLTFIQSPKTELQIQMVNTGILLPAPFWGAQFNVDEETFNTDKMGEVRRSVEWGLLENSTVFCIFSKSVNHAHSRHI